MSTTLNMNNTIHNIKIDLISVLCYNLCDRCTTVCRGVADPLFILALSAPCGKVRDSRITKVSQAFTITVNISERKASQRQREVYFTFKSVLIFQIFISFNILIVTFMTVICKENSKENTAENSIEVSLKIPSDFQSPSNGQELQLPTAFDGSTMSACFQTS